MAVGQQPPGRPQVPGGETLRAVEDEMSRGTVAWFAFFSALCVLIIYLCWPEARIRVAVSLALVALVLGMERADVDWKRSMGSGR